MAVAPVFVADLDTLKAALRLSGIPDGQDTDAILQAAIRETRVDFYRRLLHTRIAEIKAWSVVDDPDTEQEYLRLLAIDTEIKMVKLKLSYTLPMLFMDGSANAAMHWNQDPTFEIVSSRKLDKLRYQLTNEIENNMELLSGSESAGNETTIEVSVIEPDPPAPRVGSTLYGRKS